MMGNRGGINVYAYVNNNVYSLGDYLGNSYKPYSGSPKEIEGMITKEYGKSAGSVIKFPPITPKEEDSEDNTKYCLTFPAVAYEPVIVYYSYFEDANGNLIPIDGSPEQQIPGGRTVRDHEMEHARIAGLYWNSFVSESNPYEGCYCTQKCQADVKYLVEELYSLYQAKSVYFNKAYTRGNN